MKGFLPIRLLSVMAVGMLANAIALPVVSGSMASVYAATPAHATQPSITQLVHWRAQDALSRGTLQAEAIQAGSVHDTSLSTAPSHSDPKLTCSPAPCTLPNVQVSGGNHPGTRPVNETPIVAHPRNGNELLVGGNDFNCPTLQGFYTTSNQGRTWKSTCTRSLPGHCGFLDPGVGYDLKGVAYISGLEASDSTCSAAAPNQNAVALEKSTNNGRSWSAPVLVVAPVLAEGMLDKDWLQVDDNPHSPYANALYVSTTQLAEHPTTFDSTIAVSHSTDGGTTWTTSVVDTVQTFPQVDQFSDLAIAQDGTVYVSWMRCFLNTSPTGDCGESRATFYVSRSTDGGTTWSVSSPIATVRLVPNTCGSFFGCIPHTKEELADIPVIGVEPANVAHGSEPNALTDDVATPWAKKNAARLSAVFYNWTGSFTQVEVATSANGGITWGEPVPVAPATETHDQFFSWLSVNEDGIIGVTWMDRRNDPANISYEAFAAVSKNGGNSFGTNVQLATELSNPNNDGFGGTFMGDYTGNTWFDETLYASWMDSRNGVNMQDEVGGYRLED
jgi:hypothetical protein